MQINDATAVMAFQVRKKETSAAFLLWLFFGFFGGHRFYCGRPGSGVAMLLLTLASIPLTFACVGYVSLAAVAIWWIVDAALISEWIQQHNQAVMNYIEQTRMELEQGPPSLALPSEPAPGPPPTSEQGPDAT